MILLAFATAVAASISPLEALADYAACVSTTAAEFKASDLSGDTAETVVRAAQVACRKDRQTFVDAVDAFTRARHPELGPGSRAKVADLFVRAQEQNLEREVAGQIDGKGTN